MISLNKLILESLSSEKNYSGKFRDLYEFIIGTDSRDEFYEKYKSHFKSGHTIEDWEDYVRGDIGFDEEIIKSLLPKDYKIRFSNQDDMFIISKKNTLKTDNIKIDYYSDEKIISLLGDIGVGVYTEFKPRIGVFDGNNLIGGSTYRIKDNIYKFDIGILPDYQGSGIGKKLIDFIINDARKLNCEAIEAEVINEQLFEYLSSIGFELLYHEYGIWEVYRDL